MHESNWKEDLFYLGGVKVARTNNSRKKKISGVYTKHWREDFQARDTGRGSLG